MLHHSFVTLATTLISINMKSLIGIYLLFLQIVGLVKGHGRLMDPPARNSMWRFGFPNPVNYNDNELFCGGRGVQWQNNKGKCGVCGDPYHVAEPRPHEAGGLYAKGIISRHYSVGQTIDIEIELTANHYGKFVLFLCPNNNPSQVATQECFERYPLYIAGSKDVSYHIPEDGKKKAIFRYSVQLPAYVTCTQCIIQWTYLTGNQWGECGNGTTAQGCGEPETFRNCADIAILSNTGGAIPPIFAGADNPYILFYRDGRRPAPYNVFPLVVRDQVCVSNKLYKMIPGIDDWCQINCLKYPPNCPAKICTCPSTCDAIGEYAGRRDVAVHCMDQCLYYKSSCPKETCHCYEE